MRFPRGCPIKNQIFLMTPSSSRSTIFRLSFFLPQGVLLLVNS